MYSYMNTYCILLLVLILYFSLGNNNNSEMLKYYQQNYINYYYHKVSYIETQEVPENNISLLLLLSQCMLS